MTEDDLKQLLEAREALRALKVRSKTHSFRLGQIEAAQLRGGEPGPPGPPGPKGDKPAHKWVDGTKLSFENPDGSFEPPVQLKGDPGRDGIGGGGFGNSDTVTIVQTANAWFPNGW